MKKVLSTIISYNGRKFLPECLNSCKRSGIDILVIDNNSNDGSFKYLCSEKDIHLIKNYSNFGFTKATNQAIEYAINNEFDYLLLLNQDTEFEKEMINNLIESFDNNEQLAIVSPLHINEYGDFEYQFKNNLKNFGVDIEKNDSEIIEVPFVNAACWMIDLKKIQDIGFFNEILKNYGSDLDFCNRTIFSGFKIEIKRSAVIIHKKEDLEYQNDIVKTVKIHNTYYLTTLINPLKKISLLEFYFSHTKKIIKSFFTLKFKYCILTLISVFYISIKLKSIVQIRKTFKH